MLVIAGFDATRGDRASSLNLEPPSYGWMTRAVAEVADRHAHGRLVSVLEGGYDLTRLGQCVVEHVRVLLDEVTGADATCKP